MSCAMSCAMRCESIPARASPSAGHGAIALPLRAARSESESLHASIWSVVERAQPGRSNAVLSSLITAANEVIDLHELRLASIENYLPAPLFLLLFTVASVSLGFLAWAFGAANQGGRAAIVALALLIGSVLLLIMDVNRPQRGRIEIGIESLERVGEIHGRGTPGRAFRDRIRQGKRTMNNKIQQLNPMRVVTLAVMISVVIFRIECVSKRAAARGLRLDTPPSRCDTVTQARQAEARPPDHGRPVPWRLADALRRQARRGRFALPGSRRAFTTTTRIMAHANTETIVGHVTLATGAHPAAHGMIGNIWFDRTTGLTTYNIEDPNVSTSDRRCADVDADTEIDPTQKAATSDGRSPMTILDDHVFRRAGRANRR